MNKDWIDDAPYVRSNLSSGDELVVLLGVDSFHEFSVPCSFTVRRSAGPSLMGTAATLDQIADILNRWRTTGEGNGGQYIPLANYIVLSRPDLNYLKAAVEDMSRDDSLGVLLETVIETE